MLPGLNSGKGYKGDGYLREILVLGQSFLFGFLIMLYLYAFQKCSCRERPVQPFSSVGSRIIASEDTQDLISSRNCLEVEYA